jgi:hypothetical protein
MWARRKLVDCSVVETAPHMVALVEGAWAFLETGKVEASQAAYIRAYADSFPPNTRPRRLYRQIEAETCVLADDREGAIRATREAVDDGLDDLAWIESCPLLLDLRREPALAESIALVRQRADEVRRAWDEW